MQEALFQAAELTVLQPEIWLIILAAAVYGVFIGSVPGLTATMAVALFVPMTYWMEPIPALAAIVSMTACTIFAGDIPTTLLRIPGTPASAAYVNEAYRLSQRGLADRALGTALWASVVGGLFGAATLILTGERLSHIAMLFSVSEYFWLYLLGLSCPILVAHGSRKKAFLALLIGLAFSTVGLGAVHAEARFTFGIPQLYQGIGFIPAMIGLFGLSEVLSTLARSRQTRAVVADSKSNPASPSQKSSLWQRLMIHPWTNLLWPAISNMSRKKSAMLRSGTVGSIIGILPGAGADIAAWVSVALSKRARPDTPANAVNVADRTDVANTDNETSEETLQARQDAADIQCIADAGTANSAALAAGWIPSLVFGIPGDSVTAIVIGVLLMKNIEPGPAIFEKQAALVYGIYMLFILANLLLIPIGLLAIRLGGSIVRIPQNVLLPLILMFCIVGAYAINGSLFDVWTMLFMGILGFLLDRRRIPLGPVVLGIILGGPLEERFIQTISGADGSVLALIERPVAAILALLTALLWSWTAYRSCFLAGRYRP